MKLNDLPKCLDDINPKDLYNRTQLSKISMMDGRKLSDALMNHPFAPKPDGYRGRSGNGIYTLGQHIIDFVKRVDAAFVSHLDDFDDCIARKAADLRDVSEKLIKAECDIKKAIKELDNVISMAEPYREEMSRHRENIREIIRGAVVEVRTEESVLFRSGATCGVYFLMLKREIVYVGQSTNIANRIGQHAKEKEFDRVRFIRCDREHLNKVEGFFIDLLQPRLNGTVYTGCHKAALSIIVGKSGVPSNDIEHTRNAIIGATI